MKNKIGYTLLGAFVVALTTFSAVMAQEAILDVPTFVGWYGLFLYPLMLAAVYLPLFLCWSIGKVFMHHRFTIVPEDYKK